MSDHTYEDYKYHLIPTSQDSERIEKGFKGENYSGDGNWFLGHKNDAEVCDWVDCDIDLIPQWMKDLGVTGCCLDYALAYKVARTMATTEECLDGWSYQDLTEYEVS